MKPCKVDGCGRVLWAAGYCSKHYNRLRTTGTLEDGPRARLPLSVRLWKNIQKRGPDDCWLWVGATRTTGYGSINLGGRSKGSALAHRVVWEQLHGPIPKNRDHHGKVVMHTCDQRLCCNPRHLRLGSQAENVKDMDKKGRRVSAPPKGSSHWNAKLSAKQIVEIRSMSGSNAEIAKKFGVTRQNISIVRKGKGWRQID